jgi:hypothetical protein
MSALKALFERLLGVAEPKVRRAQYPAFPDPRVVSAAPLPFDPEWRVPLRLDQIVRKALDPERKVPDSPQERLEREVYRAETLSLTVEYLIDKYRQHERTTKLLRSVKAGGTSFILFLHEFTLKTTPTAFGSYTYASDSQLDVMRRR